MIRHRRTALLPILAALCVFGASRLSPGADWPQWRGPELNGSSPDTGLPAEIGPEQNVSWSVPMPGPGSSTPVVSGGRVFLTSVSADSQSVVGLCVDAVAGKILWERPLSPERKVMNNNNASPSAVADGETVCFSTGTARLAAFDFEGNERWRRDLEAEFGYNAFMFGYSSSPLLHDGTLFVPVIRNKNPLQYGRNAPEGVDTNPVESYLLAVRLSDGETVWRQERPSAAVGEAQEAYTTPAVRRAGDRTEILTYGGDALTAHDAATGEELWRWEGYNPDRINHWRVVVTPVVGGDLIYVAGPKYDKLYAIRPPAAAGGAAEVVWTHEGDSPDASTPLLYGGRLYSLHDNRKSLSCLDPGNGELKWKQGLGSPGVIRASLTGADGKLYLVYETGETVVLAAGDEYRELCRVPMGGRPARSSVAVADGRLYLRTGDTLFCFSR